MTGGSICSSLPNDLLRAKEVRSQSLYTGQSAETEIALQEEVHSSLLSFQNSGFSEGDNQSMGSLRHGDRHFLLPDT